MQGVGIEHVVFGPSLLAGGAAKVHQHAEFALVHRN